MNSLNVAALSSVNIQMMNKDELSGRSRRKGGISGQRPALAGCSL